MSQAIEDHHQMHSNGLGVSAVLDVGCSIGDSTRALADWFPSAHITVGGSRECAFHKSQETP